jgi:hypothetical protein
MGKGRRAISRTKGGWTHNWPPSWPAINGVLPRTGRAEVFLLRFRFSLLLLFLNTFSLRRINFLFSYYRPDMQKHGYRPVVMSPVSPGLLHPVLFPSVRAEASLAFAQA